MGFLTNTYFPRDHSRTSEHHFDLRTCRYLNGKVRWFAIASSNEFPPQTVYLPSRNVCCHLTDRNLLGMSACMDNIVVRDCCEVLEASGVVMPVLVVYTLAMRSNERRNHSLISILSIRTICLSPKHCLATSLFHDSS